MYASVLTSLVLISTALAAELPLDPGHFPVVPSEYDLEFAHLPRKRDLPVSDAAHGRDTLSQGDLSAPAAAPDTLSPSSVSPPATSELVSATTLVTVTSTAFPTSPIMSAVPTSTVPAVPDNTLAGVYVCDDINWNGACSHKFTKPGGSDIDCAQLSGRESSLGPDPGFLCEFFTNSSCRKLLSNESDFLSLTWPGNADLRSTDKGDLNDKLFSYVCFRV